MWNEALGLQGRTAVMAADSREQQEELCTNKA